jgi:hypothetical protein
MSFAHGVRVLLDANRISNLTEIGVIDGGEFVDVLVVSYGPHDRTLRVRDEANGKRTEYDIPADAPLEDVLNLVADAIAVAYPFEARPTPEMFRGRQARKWLKRFLRKAEQMAETLPPADGNSPAFLRVPFSSDEVLGDPNNN